MLGASATSRVRAAHACLPHDTMADVFISHARQDKDAIARPLAQELMARGYSVWFDEYTLRLGDSLPQEIDRGLASCHFGIVILSSAFFENDWPRRELDGLVAREMSEHAKCILPVRHNITPDIIKQFSPTLASKLAVSTERGLAVVTASIVQVLDETLKLNSVTKAGTPRSIILESWLRVERAIEDLADRHGCFGSPNSYMARHLRELEIINDALLGSYADLQSVRNKAVHAHDLSLLPDDVERYFERASSLVIALRHMRSPKSNPIVA
jgi:hypothetical protein